MRCLLCAGPGLITNKCHNQALCWGSQKGIARIHIGEFRGQISGLLELQAFPLGTQLWCSQTGCAALPQAVPLSGWQPLCTSPLAVDHGGVPAVVEAAAVFPQTPLLLLLSFMPQLIHSLALACCCGWVPSLVTHTHSVWQFISGWVCVCMGERKQRRALLLERDVFFSF